MNRKNGSRKVAKSLFLIGGIVAIIVLFRIITVLGESKVPVIALKHDVKLGQEITKADLIKQEISKSDYEALNGMTTNNKKLSPVILASEVNKLVGRITCNYTPAGTILRRDMFTQENVQSNPWTNNIPDDKDYEIYTMDFDSEDVDTRLLVPGSKIRIRGVLNVESQYVDEVRSQITQKEKNIYSGLSVIAEGSSVLHEYAPESNSNKSNSLVKDVPVAEIIYPSIRIVDMLNSSDESIYDVYMSLLGMSYNQRMKLLQTSVTEKSSSFMKRVTPKKLVLVVSAEDASQLAEFENLEGMNFKYTILPNGNKGEEEDLYEQLVGVSDSIFNFTESYNATSK